MKNGVDGDHAEAHSQGASQRLVFFPPGDEHEAVADQYRKGRDDADQVVVVVPALGVFR